MCLWGTSLVALALGVSLVSSQSTTPAPRAIPGVPFSAGVGCGFPTAYPYRARHACTDEAAWSIEVEAPAGASLLQLEFSYFNLPATDRIVITGLEHDNMTKSVVYRGGHVTSAAFNSTPIFASNVTVSLFTSIQDAAAASRGCIGFAIDYLITAIPSAKNESMCGVDDTLEAPCFRGNPGIWAASHTVVRLLINKSGKLSGCTGWLLGSEGHLMTCNHCVDNLTDAGKTRIEFMAQAPVCPGPGQPQICQRQLACTGRIYTGRIDFVRTSGEYDYTLLKLDPWVAASYGYARLKATGPVVGEPIYIVEHPSAYGKRIVNKVDGGGPGLVLSMASRTDISYRLDTLPMASGSPVFNVKDNAVVALHHAGETFCPNLGVRSNLILTDLTKANMLPKDAVFK